MKKWGWEKRPAPIQAFFDDHGKFPIDKKSAIELLESLYEDDIQEEIRWVKVPSLICHGDRDGIIPVEAAGLWQRALGNSRIEIFKNCGHAVFLEEPLSFNNILENFFLDYKWSL